MTGEYEVKAEHLRPYHEWLTQLAGKFSSVSWEWVPREQNQRADALSKQALADHAPLAARHRPRSTMP